MTSSLVLTPIGIIHTPFDQPRGMPIQPAGAGTTPGEIVLDEIYRTGLQDLAGFSHIILLYHFHRSAGYDLKLTPFLDDKPHGVFATRAPRRPNPLGLSIVQLEKIDGCTLHVFGIDVLDGTPLFDIKPYVTAFDQPENVRSGWLEGRDIDVSTTRADQRFNR